ncbi:MAG: hypothetical protein KTR18_10000 [Acidiferrobacterales bacterium]|nr:hypothetical protein [Acidiferrobacterales bacterium]
MSDTSLPYPASFPVQLRQCIRELPIRKALVTLTYVGLWLICAAVHAQQRLVEDELLADFVWSEEYSGGSRILYSRFDGKVWSTAQTVYEDDGLNILPAIAAISEVDMMVIWSVVNPRGITLKYSRTLPSQEKSNLIWSPGSVLTEKRIVNLAPVVLPVDGSYRAYWSSHEGGDDDVFSSTLNQEGWTEPKMIHAENESADVLPIAGFNRSQGTWLTWESIGQTEVDYPILQFDTRFGAEGERNDPLTTAEIEILEQESLERFDLDPPVFFRSKSRATMYIRNPTTHPVRLFPGNLVE